MKIRSVFFCVALSVLLLSAQLFSQKLQPPAPPQTARQALIEMITGGRKEFNKHLTVEVQQLLAKAGSNGLKVTAIFDSMRSQLHTGTQTFDSGPVLLVATPPGEHFKLEVRIENDDLSGDEDTLILSPHAIPESSDRKPEEWEAFLSDFRVQMKRQDGIWRLNKVGVGLEFALGDPEVLTKAFLREPEPVSKKTSSPSESQAEARAETPVSPEAMLNSLAFMELAFAHQHPEQGFTCSLPDLARSLGGDNLQISNGMVQGYKLSLTGCQGRPAGSFQLVAEPMAQGGKAYCTDATRNMRVADDGRGGTCLAFGRVLASEENEGGVGMEMIAPPPRPKD
jgi:hypothetical protein